MKESSKREFLLKFCNASSIVSLKSLFIDLVGKTGYYIFLDSAGKTVDKHKRLSGHLSGFKASKEVCVFNCSCNKTYISVPMMQGDTLYGYLLLVHLEREPDKRDVNFMKYFVHIALKECQKEQELTKLYDTIRPRAIALSTIHTIHRLLSSTLDMDELIERITRLTLQVMRARCCSIMLIDKTKSYLIPKAVIDLNDSPKRNKKHRRIKIGTKTEGWVSKTGKIKLDTNCVCVPLIEEDIIGVICVKYKTNKAAFNNFDLEILVTLAEQAVIAIKNAQLYEEQQKLALGSIKSLAALLDTKSPNIYTHSEQFVKIALAIAEEMKIPREKIRYLRYAALLPDTGRFSIPDDILKKKGGLSKNEYNIIKKQHLESLKILEHLEFLKPALPVIIYHHERYDGTGYPEGLKGEQIPIGARIMAVADAFEAMVSARPHKDSKISIQQALKEIKKNKGSQFDPRVVDAFIAVSKKQEFKELF